jgi:flagellar protein FlbD
MIQLTRLNGHSMAVNSDLIKFVEQSPDTVITLITGEKVVVKESTAEVMSRILEFRRAVLAAAAADCSLQSSRSSYQDVSK